MPLQNSWHGTRLQHSQSTTIPVLYGTSCPRSPRSDTTIWFDLLSYHSSPFSHYLKLSIGPLFFPTSQSFHNLNWQWKRGTTLSSSCLDSLVVKFPCTNIASHPPSCQRAEQPQLRCANTVKVTIIHVITRPWAFNNTDGLLKFGSETWANFPIKHYWPHTRRQLHLRQEKRAKPIRPLLSFSKTWKSTTTTTMPTTTTMIPPVTKIRGDNLWTLRYYSTPRNQHVFDVPS